MATCRVARVLERAVSDTELVDGGRIGFGWTRDGEGGALGDISIFTR